MVSAVNLMAKNKLNSDNVSDVIDNQSASLKSDDQLMVSYARGDKLAFDQLYLRYKQPVYRYLFRNCSNIHATDEMFQEVWLRLITASKRYQNKGKFRAWIFTLAHNCLIDYYRKSAKLSLQKTDSAETIEATSLEQASSITTISDERQGKIIHRILSELPQEQKEAFYLRQDSDFSINEIAAIQQVTPEAAKSRLRYAYKKLRGALEDRNS